MPMHVITESVQDYRQREWTIRKLTIKLIWYIFLSYFISTFIGLFTNNLEIQNLSWLGLIAVFAYADFVEHGKIKSYVKLFLAGVYLVVAALFVYTLLTILPTPKEPSLYPAVTGAVLAAIFTYAGYRNIKRYSNAIYILKRKLGIR